LVQFEKTLAKEPNRLGAFVGAARAAKAAGDTAKAQSYYARVVALTADGEGERIEIIEARSAAK
jgi:uncharacterized protein HemY